MEIFFPCLYRYTLTALLNTLSDYCQNHNMPINILEKLRTIFKDISECVAENKKIRDKLFPFLLNALIREYWAENEGIPPIESLFEKNFTIDPSLFLQTLLNNINLSLAGFQSHFCKAKNMNKDKLYKNLNDILKSQHF